jgi:RHS repeat-associated protein
LLRKSCVGASRAPYGAASRGSAPCACGAIHAQAECRDRGENNAGARRTQRSGSASPTVCAGTAANRQLTWGGQTLTYDDNGNLTGDGTNTYTWDARNRLATISEGTTASFQYDPFGRRTRKVIAGQTTDFLYDDRNPVQELSGGTVLGNLLTGLGIDEYFTRTDGSGRRTLLGDALGSILALTDDAGTVQTTYTYEPFGNTAAAGQSNGNSFQYTGRENDVTSLYYYRARYYHPTFQRFVSEDPIGFQGGDVDLYSFVRQDPIGFVDPLGLNVTIAYYPTLATHLGIGINNNPTVGFYPTNRLYGLFSILGVNVPGAIRQDTGVPAKVVIIKTTTEQDRIIQDAINGRMTNPGYYNLYGRNCAEFVSDVLRAGEVSVPRAWLPETIVNNRTLSR